MYNQLIPNTVNMRSIRPILCFILIFIIKISAQRSSYDYQGSYPAYGNAAIMDGCNNCQPSFYGKAPMDISGSTWINQQREEMHRRAEQLRKQFHEALNTGNAQSAHYQRYHSTLNGGSKTDCKDHMSNLFQKIEERKQMIPPPIVHHVRKFEESKNIQQAVIPETTYRFNKEIEHRRQQSVQPVSDHMKRFFEEQHRQVIQEPPLTHRIEKQIEESNINRIVSPPVQRHQTQRTESHHSRTEQIPVYGNSYFSISQADRHRQYSKPFPQVFSKHHLEESSVNHNQELKPKQQIYAHKELHESKVHQAHPITNFKKIENIEVGKFEQPSFSTIQKNTENKSYNHHYTPQTPATHVIKEVEYEDTHHYNKQYEKKINEKHDERQLIIYPKWVQKQSDRLIFEEYYRQCVIPQEYGRNLTRSEEERFYEYYNRQGGTTLNEIRENFKRKIIYPSYLVTTEEKNIFDEFYITRVGIGSPARNLTSYELEEFEDYYRRQLANKIQEQEKVYKANNYNLKYPDWVITETDKKIFEEYYFSHVLESEYGRDLTKDERVEFEVYYTEHGGTTDHNVETYSHSGYRIIYPDWVVTTEDRAIYEEYYRTVVGENYGRELSQEEILNFERYYEEHGGTTKHENVIEEDKLSFNIVYPSWIVTQVDKIIFEEFYRLRVDVREYGRELSNEEMLMFEEYYKQRGGTSRRVLEETLFMRLVYPSWLRTEYDRIMYREFYLRLVDIEDYGRILTDEESIQFTEYYDRHTKGQYETLRGQIDYQWVYPSFVVSKSDRRIFNSYYNQCMKNKLELGRQLTENEKIEFQQWFIEKGGLYEYRYTREEYLLTFELNREIGGSAYQWTWDGVEHLAAELTHLIVDSPDVHHTDEYDKKVYGSTKEEEPIAPSMPIELTTVKPVEKPKKIEISKDRGDQPPQHYEEEIEAEPGIGEYEAPQEALDIKPSPSEDFNNAAHRSNYERYEEHSAPVKYSEYRRRYEHQRTQSRIVPGGPDVSLTAIQRLGHNEGSHSNSAFNHNEQEGNSHNFHQSATNNLNRQFEFIDQDMKTGASSHNSQWLPDNTSASEEIETDNPDLLTEDEYENVDLEYPEDQQRAIN
uniref:CSON014732 protein n=1 Tax=Culicoides sonorensis TaxID=179676 RepID=A0A336ME87_CULSO